MTLEYLEKKAYEYVKHNVGLKNSIKRIYQVIFSAFSGVRVDTELDLTERQRSFFGFHDKSPWSSDGKFLLGHIYEEGEGVGEAWRKGTPIGIGVYEGDHWENASIVAHTRAWNWQQGAQLQWLGNEEKIIYNDFRDGLCSAVVFNLDAGREEELEYPVAAVSRDGRRYASVCFKTFGRAMDGYGYAFESTESTSNVEPGTLIVKELNGGEMRLALEDLDVRIQPCSDMEGVDFFSHCLFSPDGQRLLFLRRQSVPNRRLRSEMFCLDIVSGTARRIPFNDMVSHFTWLGEKKVLAYANTKEEGDGFYVVDVESGTVSNWTSRLNDRDGHPHATPHGDIVVFDTYPSRTRHQHLFAWGQGDQKAHAIAKFYSPMRFWEASRVDLHPRVREDGQYVSFDAGFSGTRSLFTAKLPSGIQEYSIG